MKLVKNLGLATIAATISITAINAHSAEAAIVKYNFTVNATSGDNPGTYFGYLQYDDSFLTGLGLENLGASEGLKVAFNYLDTNYTEADDEAFDAFPIVSFNDGQLLGLSYFVPDQFLIGNAENLNVGANMFYTISDSINTTQVGTVKFAKVPEPFAVGGTAIATTLGLWMKRKKKAALAS